MNLPPWAPATHAANSLTRHRPSPAGVEAAVDGVAGSDPARQRGHLKLHPCNKTLNSRNLGFAKDSFKVSFGFRTLWRPRLIKDPKNVKNHWFYCVFAQKCKKTHMVLLCFRSTLLKKPLVLLRFRSKILKKHWFYLVFEHVKKWKKWFYCEKN